MHAHRALRAMTMPEMALIAGLIALLAGAAVSASRLLTQSVDHDQLRQHTRVMLDRLRDHRLEAGGFTGLGSADLQALMPEHLHSPNAGGRVTLARRVEMRLVRYDASANGQHSSVTTEPFAGLTVNPVPPGRVLLEDRYVLLITPFQARVAERVTDRATCTAWIGFLATHPFVRGIQLAFGRGSVRNATAAPTYSRINPARVRSADAVTYSAATGYTGMTAVHDFESGLAPDRVHALCAAAEDPPAAGPLRIFALLG